MQAEVPAGQDPETVPPFGTPFFPFLNGSTCSECGARVETRLVENRSIAVYTPSDLSEPKRGALLLHGKLGPDYGGWKGAMRPLPRDFVCKTALDFCRRGRICMHVHVHAAV